MLVEQKDVNHPKIEVHLEHIAPPDHTSGLIVVVHDVNEHVFADGHVARPWPIPTLIFIGAAPAASTGRDRVQTASSIAGTAPSSARGWPEITNNSCSFCFAPVYHNILLRDFRSRAVGFYSALRLSIDQEERRPRDRISTVLSTRLISKLRTTVL